LFKEFRDDIFQTDPIRDQLLSQWFGYNTVPDMSLDTVMLFTGVPRSGKSTLLDVLGRMLGRDQCVSVDFRDLISPFGREPMLGKLAALLGDVKSPRPSDAETALEMILRISGGDPVGVNRKGIKQLAQVYLTIRFTMAMNNLPVFSDHARAFQARLAIIGFDKSYVGKEKPELKQQLIKEAAQGKMINYALQGLKDLRERGRFIVPDSSRPIMELMTQISSPVTVFVYECCKIEEGLSISRDMLFDAWRSWCDETGHRPGLREQFGRWLISTVPMLKVSRIRNNGRRVYMHVGIGLQEWATNQYLGRK
jgi:putative DNA primase/helicase